MTVIINSIISSSAVSFFLTILSIILSVLFFVKGIKYRLLAYTKDSICITDTNYGINKIGFSFGNKPIKNLTITDIVIWCAGKQMIDHSDMATLKPLSISIDNSYELLEYQILKTNEPDNDFILSRNNNTIIINFDYLTKNNGIIIRLYHTGNNNDVSISGRIKDGKKLLYVKPRVGLLYNFLNIKLIRKILSTKLSSLIFLIFTIFLFPNAFIQSANYNVQNNILNLPETSLFLNLDSFVIIVLCLLSFILSIPHIINLFRFDPPSSLNRECSCKQA